MFMCHTKTSLVINLDLFWKQVFSYNELDDFKNLTNFNVMFFFWLKRVLDQGPEQRESKMTVLCPLIIIILIS